jgi:hypothetical protein
MLVDGVPQPELGGDAMVEPVQDREAVAAFRRCRETEQLLRLHAVEELSIRRCCRVVELIDNDDIKMIGCKVVEVSGIETLNRRKDVFEMSRAGAADPLLAKRRVTQRIAEGGQALVKNLVSVRDEQQARPRQVFPE